MKISELSKATGVSQRMLRHFEQIGLLTPKRGENDYRYFDHADIERVREIREWQRLGLTLREIREIFDKPEHAALVLRRVLARERSLVIEKQRGLRELRKKLGTEKLAFTADRVTHPIPHAENVLEAMRLRGWKPLRFDYIRFSDWQNTASAEVYAIGEMIWQSAVYLLTASDRSGGCALSNLMRDFSREAHRVWPALDAHPPVFVEREDIAEFFAPNDVIVPLEFEAEMSGLYSIILPYDAIFSLAQACRETA